MEYVLFVAILLAITASIAGSLNLSMGLGGIPLLGHFAFPLVGAYVIALSSARLGLPSLLGLCLAPWVGALAAILFLWPCSNLNPERVALATIAIALLMQSVLDNWTQVTNGPYGIDNVPSLAFGGSPLTNNAIAAFTYALLTILGLNRIRHSQFGRLLTAHRDNPLLLAFWGRRSSVLVSRAVLLSAAWAAIGGALYATFIGYVSPNSYTFNSLLLVVVMVFLGGRGTLWGPALGATVVTLLFEMMRFLGLPSSISAQIQLILCGIILLALVVVRPHGILGRRLQS